MLNSKALPVLKSLSHLLFVQGQATEVNEILSPLPRDVGAHVPRVSLHRQRLLRQVKDVFAPRLLCGRTRFDCLDFLVALAG